MSEGTLEWLPHSGTCVLVLTLKHEGVSLGRDVLVRQRVAILVLCG